MKRLVDTVLGLLFAQVCCELGLPHRGIWRNEQLLFCWRRERSWQVLQTFYPYHLWGWGCTFRVLQELCDPHLWVFLSSSGVRGMDVAQSPPALSLQEGASSTLRCNFSTLADNVQWYLQNPRGPPHPPVLRSFRDKAEWKIKRHDSPYRTPQLPAHFLFADHRLGHLLLCCAAQCSPGTCRVHTNPPQGSAPPQPQSHPEATTGRLQCLMLLTYISTVLTTDTFWPYRLGPLVFRLGL